MRPTFVFRLFMGVCCREDVCAAGVEKAGKREIWVEARSKSVKHALSSHVYFKTWFNTLEKRLLETGIHKKRGYTL